MSSDQIKAEFIGGNSQLISYPQGEDLTSKKGCLLIVKRL